MVKQNKKDTHTHTHTHTIHKQDVNKYSENTRTPYM